MAHMQCIMYPHILNIYSVQVSKLIDSMQYTYYPDISRVTILYYINKVAGYILSSLTLPNTVSISELMILYQNWQITEATVCMIAIEQHQFWIELPWHHVQPDLCMSRSWQCTQQCLNCWMILINYLIIFITCPHQLNTIQYDYELITWPAVLNIQWDCINSCHTSHMSTRAWHYSK